MPVCFTLGHAARAAQASVHPSWIYHRLSPLRLPVVACCFCGGGVFRLQLSTSRQHVFTVDELDRLDKGMVAVLSGCEVYLPSCFLKFTLHQLAHLVEEVNFAVSACAHRLSAHRLWFGAAALAFVQAIMHSLCLTVSVRGRRSSEWVLSVRGGVSPKNDSCWMYVETHTPPRALLSALLDGMQSCCFC
jgi:hypothetical protein